MTLDEPGLKAEDHAYRRAAETYFEQKGKIAKDGFDPRQLETFLAFESHWRDFFAPSDELRLSEYLATPFEVRKSQFERFLRECRTWEVSFQFCIPKNGSSRPAPTASTGQDKDRDQLKRRIEASREKAEAVREFYSNLDNLLDKERQRRQHPIELLTHLRVLGVPADATLDDVKKQYYKLARLHHPDLNGDPVKMRRVSEAYRAILAFYKVA